MNLRLDQHIKLHDKDYWIIGIDSYYLKNFLDKNISWRSYSLISQAYEKAWISRTQGEEFFVRWSAISKAAFEQVINNNKSCVFNLALSGIADISFEGDRGYATPLAETLYFDVKDQEYNYIASERFLEIYNKKLEYHESVYMTGVVCEIGAFQLV